MAEDEKLARERKLANKKFNEHIKLLVTSFNAVALTTFGAGVLLPRISGSAVTSSLIWFSIAAALYVVAHVALRFLRSED